MPSSRQLISSQVLGTSAATVTFSAIPGTFKDLVLRVSCRDTTASNFRDFFMRFNGDSSSLYSYTYVQGSGSAASSSASTGETWVKQVTGSQGSTTTANTFSSLEFYIPSYTASQSKPISGISAMERDATGAYITAAAHLYRSNTAISSLTCYGDSTFDSGSSFYLYGLAS